VATASKTLEIVGWSMSANDWRSAWKGVVEGSSACELERRLHLALLGFPAGRFFDKNGGLYIAGSGNGRVRPPSPSYTIVGM